MLLTLVSILLNTKSNVILSKQILLLILLEYRRLCADYHMQREREREESRSSKEALKDLCTYSSLRGSVHRASQALQLSVKKVDKRRRKKAH